MTLGIFIGISIGFALSALWSLFLRLLFKAQNVPQGEIPPEPVLRIGPFLHKKSKGKRKPVSHTDSEVFEREMRESGRMI
jgi:hypothetical protein